MAPDDALIERIREALAHLPDVEEKRMFRGTAFMVNGKMCVSVGRDELMCRIDPAGHAAALQRKGCRTVVMNGREYRGYVYVGPEGTARKEDFEVWIGLALAYNPFAKASPKRKKRAVPSR